MAKAKKYRSISKRLPIMVSITFIILVAIVLVITYNREEKRMVEEYRKMADGVTNLMIERFDPNKIDIYLEENYSSRDYLDIMKYYYSLKDNYPDIYYLYVYQFYKADVPAATIIIDLEDEYTEEPNQVSIDWVGSTYIALEPFASLIDDILTSKEPIFKAAYSDEDGYLLSYVKPIFDEDGNYVASACVDFSMEEMHKENIRFILTLGVIIILIGAAVIACFTIFELRRTITKPLAQITDIVSEFKYDTEDDMAFNYETLKNLKLNSNNEIGVLYDALLIAEKDSLFYMSNYKQAESEILTKDEKINELGSLALRDGMTNVGNKEAFTNTISNIQDNERYGIVIFDVNSLNMINDKYGHDAGDAYIVGCCKVVSDIFSHSPVFRIGGDKFAIILKGRDYVKREELFQNTLDMFDRIWEELEKDPAHRYSCALGMADSTSCNTTRETIKTAEDNMKENKRAFKEKNNIN